MPSSPARTWLLRLSALAMGLALVGGLELALRASGAWADPPAPRLPAGWDQGARLVERQQGPLLEPFTLHGAPAWRTARGLVERRFLHDLAWTHAPPPGLRRVFAFGGSTTLGVPVEDTVERTFPARLAEGLRSLSVQAEVLNLGGASFGSDQELALMGEVALHGASDWVLYSLNNEFFQAGLAIYQENASYPTTRLHLQRWHLFRALQGLLARRTSPAPLAEVVGQQRLVVARVVEATLRDPAARPARDERGRWTRRDPVHAAVIARFRANLLRMEALAAQAGARLFLVDVQPHLQQAPWLSLHDPAVGALTRARVEDAVARSAAARAAGLSAEAEGLARRAVEGDPMYAAGWHALGMALLDQGRLDPARAALQDALELDMDPGRPPRGLSQALAEVSADGGSVRVSLDGLWSAPDAGPFGARLFHDSCHLTPQAYDRLGMHLAMTLWLEGAPP